jgi:CelD/BcsL family acetyltransferase involved in cellulose biosynthesis
MRVEVIRGGELTADLAQRWRDLLAADPAFASPYVHPELTRAAAAVRDDVYVGLLHDGSRLAGFFPFQRSGGRGDEGKVVAEGVCDYQAVVAEPGLAWSAEELLRGCGLRSWSFTYLAAGQAPFRPFHRQLLSCASMDLSQGYAAWAAARRASGSRLVKDTARHRRRLERAAGPLRFALHTADAGVLARLMEWKSAQYRRTGKTDWFAIPWVAALVERLHGLETPGFAGLLSALWAGDELVAAHFGLRSRTVWHWWYPAYDRRYAADSPGLILDLAMAEHAGSLGLERIDLGRVCDHKARLMSGCTELARGIVEVG